jgi:hypothetical protein
MRRWWESRRINRKVALGTWHKCVLFGLTLFAGTVTDSSALPGDLRPARLESFFMSYGCPTPHYVNDYVRAADAFQVDYRLLPVISLLESTCGTYSRLNNHWGWDGAEVGFESVPAGINFVTSQLAGGRPYRDKALDEKLHSYNPKPRYRREVKRLMNRIETESFPALSDSER